MIYENIKAALITYHNAFLDIEEENQELFEELKNVLMFSIVGGAGIASAFTWVLSVNGGKHSIPGGLVLGSGLALLLVFIILAFYRCWERVKFEYSSPYAKS